MSLFSEKCFTLLVVFLFTSQSTLCLALLCVGNHHLFGNLLPRPDSVHTWRHLYAAWLSAFYDTMHASEQTGPLAWVSSLWPPSSNLVLG